MPKIEVTYFEGTDKFREIRYSNDKGELHNENGPAKTLWFPDGKKRREEYYFNDILHNENGAAYISYYESDQKENELFCLNGKFLTKKEWKNEQARNYP